MKPAVILACLLAAMPAARAATNAPDRVRRFAALPDWTGLWEMGRPAGPQQPPAGKPGAPPGPGHDIDIPYRPEWQARYQARQAQYAALPETLTPPDPTITRCAWGFPRMELGPANFEFIITPEETMMIFDPSEIRHVYTDGRSHPAAPAPSPQGNSVGQWKNQALLVDTVGLDPTLWFTAAGAQLSPRAHITERWSMQDSNHISDEITIDDPVALTRSLSFTRKFHRVQDTARQIMQNCFENDREILKGGYIQTIYAGGGQ